MVYGIYRPWMRRPNTTIINHYNYMNTPNGCGYGTGGCGGGISNKAWNWIFGLTVGTGLLGGILGGISQNRQARRDEQTQQALLQQQATEQAEALKKQEAKENIKNTAQQLKQAYGDKYNVMYDDNGIFLVDKKDPSKSYYGETLEDFIKKMGENESPTPTTTETDEENKELDELKEIVAEQGETIEALTAQLAAKENGNTPAGNDGTGTPKPVTGNTTLPGGYTWGKRDTEANKKYADKTVDELITMLYPNASEEEKTALRAAITNMNPNAIKDNKVVNTDLLDLPQKVDGGETESPEQSVKGWQIAKENNGQDAEIKVGDTTYKIRCRDGCDLNKNKLVDHSGNIISLNSNYHNKNWASDTMQLINQNDKTFIELMFDKETNRFILKNLDPVVYLEEFLNNPSVYSAQMQSSSKNGGGGAVAQANGTTSASGTDKYYIGSRQSIL